MQEFIEFYLEPEILGNVSYTHRLSLLDQTERIGVDESGKGDFFGPLCVAGVYANGEAIIELSKMGVKDSKALGDATILKLAKGIAKNFVHSIVRISPKRYNELYRQFRNLNSLLAWGHASVIENLTSKTKCPRAIIDQFAAKHVVVTALKRKQIEIELTQQHRAESDVVVAAASILARAAFLEGLAALGERFGVVLPKGASALTQDVAREIVDKHGVDSLEELCKTHFKTYLAIKDGKGEKSQDPGPSQWDDNEQEFP